MKSLMVILLSFQHLPYLHYTSPSIDDTTPDTHYINPKIIDQINRMELYIGDELELENVNPDNMHLIDDILHI